jgi:hypothetical protein
LFYGNGSYVVLRWKGKEALKILSWNIKNFTSTVRWGEVNLPKKPSDMHKAFNILLKVIADFDLIAIYVAETAIRAACPTKRGI